MSKVGALTSLVTALNGLVTTITSSVDTAMSATTGLSLDTTQLYNDLAALQSIQTIGGASFTATTSISPDGTMIVVNLDEGLGPILTQNVIDILNNLNTALNNLSVTVTGPDPLGLDAAAAATINNTILYPAVALVTPVLNGVLNPLLSGTGTIVQQLLTASVLGATTVNIPTSINVPTISSGLVDSKFVGTVVQTNTLDVNLLSTANGVSDVYWAGVPTAPTATATGNSTSGYTVTGTGVPNATITIKDSTGTTVATTTTDASGNYSTNVAGTVGQNATLTATATNTYGTSAGTNFQTPANPIVPNAPIITNVVGNSQTGYTVTGTAPAGSTVNIYENGTVVGTAVADSTGNFTINLPGSVGANAALTATATDGAGNVSASTTLTTPADPIPAPPTATATGNSTTGYTVTGTAEANSTVVITNPTTNTVLGTAVAGSTGSYTIILPAGTQPGETLNATATNTFGTSSATTFVTPADPIPASPTATITGNSKSGYTVTGTATIGSTVNVIDPGTGQVLGTTVAASDGSYTINIPVGTLAANQPVNVTATTPAGTSTPTTITSPNDPTVSSPIISTITGNSTTGYVVSGTADPNTTVTITNALGQIVGTATTDASGNFQVTLNNTVVASEQLGATATDS